MNELLNTQTILSDLFKKWANEDALSIKPIGNSGSNRRYFRVYGTTKKCIGAFNEDIKENNAFFHFSKVFKSKNINVPEVIEISDNKKFYILSDLGDISLFDLRVNETAEKVSKQVDKLYRKSIKALLEFQFIDQNLIDFNYCIPRDRMDSQSFQWDLNYFKYYFLKPKNILFDEQRLEDDFQNFIKLLLQAEQNYFVFRDFQARNIMILDDEPYFIDYQGGRKGALQYDLASILYQVKAKLPDDFKTELIDYYTSELKNYSNINKEEFLKHFYPYVLVRLLQVLGAYGFRGLIEKRQHFIDSISFALESLNNSFRHFTFLDDLPELRKCLFALYSKEEDKKGSPSLNINIKSFAYKAGIPKDESGHGEGYVFDCRALPNPGRLKEYQHLSGLDDSVKTYLNEYPDVHQYKDHVFQIVEQSTNNYIERGFTNLNINFGCTGGQHRSVYFAEHLNSHLKNKYNINVLLTHTQKNNWKKIDE